MTFFGHEQQHQRAEHEPPVQPRGRDGEGRRGDGGQQSGQRHGQARRAVRDPERGRDGRQQPDGQDLRGDDGEDARHHRDDGRPARQRRARWSSGGFQHRYVPLVGELLSQAVQQPRDAGSWRVSDLSDLA